MVIDRIAAELNLSTDVIERDIRIQVQSKQNYRQHEWEEGMFRAVYEKVG